MQLLSRNQTRYLCGYQTYDYTTKDYRVSKIFRKKHFSFKFLYFTYFIYHLLLPQEFLEQKIYIKEDHLRHAN